MFCGVKRALLGMAETDLFGAYHRISGAPSWVKSETYDLQAKVDRDHTDQLRELGIDQYQLMLSRFWLNASG